MDPKPPTSSVSLYKEVRTSLPAQSIIQLQLPSTSSFSVRSRQQRRVVRTPTRCKDEETFKNNYLANSGSLFFGKSKRYPQNFLWRVLGDGRVLELRSADLSKSNGESREASLSLHLYFPGALKYGCVALADSDEDILNIFALTRANELYTIALRKDFFCHVAASDEDVSRWCKTIKPSSFSISTPHRLIVSSTLELIISLSDGRLLRLNREKGDDGSKWAETCYGDAQWASSLRGLVRWQGSNTVKYDDTILEQGTPTAIAVSPDRNHTFAVCLNHQLRVWNPNNGNCVFSKDLLWVHRERHEIPKMMLDPGSSNFLQIFQSDGAVEGDLYYAVTFSPHDLGQFKFWGVRDPDYGEGGIRDLFPDCPLKPPDPDPTPESKAIWKVADFKVKSGRTGKGLEMWILMQSNRSYKLYGLTFDILDLAVVWQDQWFTMASETHGHGQQPQVSSLDPKDATDKWLDFIFSASEIPDSVLETALSMYNSEGSVAPSDTNASLKERSCAAIGSQVGSMMSGITPSSYRKIVDQEWTRLWQYIRDLNRTRWHILSLSYDNNVGMPWIAFADGCSAIRTCDKIEIMTQNSPRVLAGSLGMLEAPSIEMDPANDPKLPDELAVLIQAATGFRRNFSYALQRTCRSILAEELWLNPTNSIPLRIQSFYDRCNFAEEIDTVRFEELAKALDRIGGFDCLETGTFFAILDELVYSLPLEGSGLLHTNFGRSLLINGAREMIDQRQGMLYDLLTFIVFVDMEIDREEMPMENFDAPQIYSRLLDLLKQYRISQWLAESTRIEKPSSLTRPSSSHMPKEQFSSSPPGRTSTILESLFALDLSAQSHKDQSQSEALTYSIKDLLQWVVGGNDPDVSLDDVPVYIQTDLLAHHDIDLACDFVRYQPSTAWSAYIKGRLSLMKGDVTEAAIHFKKAAFKLCKSITNQSKFNMLMHHQLVPRHSITALPPILSSNPWKPLTLATVSQPTTPISSTSSTPIPIPPKWRSSPTSPSNIYLPPKAPIMTKTPLYSPHSFKPPYKRPTSPLHSQH